MVVTGPGHVGSQFFMGDEASVNRIGAASRLVARTRMTAHRTGIGARSRWPRSLHGAPTEPECPAVMAPGCITVYKGALTGDALINRSHRMSLYSSRIQYRCAESTYRPRLQCNMPITFSAPVCNHGCAFQVLHVM